MYDHVDYLYNTTKMELTKSVFHQDGTLYGNPVGHTEYFYSFNQTRAKVTGSGKLLWIPIDNDYSKSSYTNDDDTSYGVILNSYHKFVIDGKIEFIPENYLYTDKYITYGTNGRTYYRTTDKWIYFNKSIEAFYDGYYGKYDDKYNIDFDKYDSMMDTDQYNKTVGKYLVYWND